MKPSIKNIHTGQKFARFLNCLLCIVLIFSTACTTQPTATLPAPTQTSAPQAPAGPAPVLVETVPPEGSTLDASRAVIFYFSQPMERASVEGGMVFWPELQGEFEWLDDATVRFVPAPLAIVPTSLRVDLGATIQDAQGIVMRHGRSLFYSMPEGLDVRVRSPQSSARQDPTSPVTIRFNQPVAQQDSSAKPVAAFTIIPEVEGNGRWVTNTTYAFFPSQPFRGDATYTVQVNLDLSTVDGLSWLPGLDPATYTWSFTTLPLNIKQVTPRNTTRLVNPDAQVTIEFNQPMATTSVEARFGLFDSQFTSVPGTYTWENHQTRMIFTPDEYFKREETYAVRLLEGAQSQGGEVLKAGLQKHTFSTVGNFLLTRPSRGFSDVVAVGEWSKEFYFGFSTAVDLQSMQENIRFDPPVENVSVYSNDAYLGDTYISATLKPDIKYTLILGAGIKDQWGQALGQEYVYTFETIADSWYPSSFFYYPSPNGWDTRPNLIFFEAHQPVISALAYNIPSVHLSYAPITLEQVFNEDFRAEPQAEWDYPLSIPQGATELVKIPLKPGGGSLPTGFYQFIVDPEEPVVKGNDYYYDSQDERLLGVVSRVNLLVKETPEELLVWAVSLVDFQPVRGETVVVMDYGGGELARGTTDSQGLARLPLPQEGDDDRYYYDDRYVMLASPGRAEFGFTTTTWNLGTTARGAGFRTDWNPPDTVEYLYVDRPIYRPGQTVYFRGVTLGAQNGRYFQTEEATATVILYEDYYYGQGYDVSTAVVKISPYGTFSGSFPLSPSIKSGTYFLKIHSEEDNYSYNETSATEVQIQVEEYRKPEIDLQIDLPDQPVVAGEVFQAMISTRYFFGAVAPNMQVSWKLYEDPDYFYIPRFATGRIGDWSYYCDEYWCGGSDYFFLSGEGVTDDNGELIISIPELDMISGFGGISMSRLRMRVTTQGGKELPVTSEATFTYHPDRFYVGVRPVYWISPAGENVQFQVRTVDWDLNGVGPKELNAELKAVTWEENDGGYHRIVTPIQKISVTTDETGSTFGAFAPVPAGIYLIEVSGGRAVSEIYQWVAGPEDSPWPSMLVSTVRLQTDATSYKPGEVARVIIPNPYPQDTIALVTRERSSVLETQVIELQGATTELEVPLSDADAPNVYLTVTVLGRRSDGAPDFIIGYANLVVEPAAFELQVTLTPSSSRVQPGGDVLFELLVTDAQGQPVEGEFSLALVDKAIYALAKDNTVPILDVFYSQMPLGVFNSLSLAGYAQRRTLITQPPGQRGGGGGDGEMYDELSTSAMREEFSDTAYWNPSIQTDANGKALIQIKLPDNLTSWVAVARGLTKDARVGEGRTELIASKDLIIRPSTPRFVVIGDHLQLAATVHNTSGRDLRGVKVSLDCAGIILDAQTPAMQTIDLPKDQTLRVYWGVTVENVEAINPVFTARLGDFSDSTLSPWGELTVYKNPYPYELRAHGMLDQAGEQWEVIPLPRYFVPEGGSVQVRLSLTPALETLSGLRMLKQNLDLKLTEPVISVLFPNVETYLALQNEAAKDPLLKLELEGAIQKSIDRLISLQRLSGGWGRTYFEAEDPYLSAYAVYALARAQEAGFTVNEVVYKKAYNFVSGRKASYNGKIADWRNNREAFILYVRSYIGVKNIAKEAEPFFLNRSKLEPWALAMLALVYHNEAPQGSEVGQLVQDLEDSISYQNDGVYWRAVAEHYEILGTDNFATAVALIALTQLDPGWGPLWEAATYLAGNTRSDGTWGSSYDTAWTIAALNRLVEKDIAEDFSYAADLNGVEFASAPSPATGTLALANYTVSLDQLDLKGMNVLHVERGAGMGRLFYSVLVALEQPIAQIQASTRGLKIERTYYVASRDCVKILCQPIQSISMAQSKDIMVRLTVYVPRKIYNVVVEDYIPAGTELINMSLASEVQVRTLGEDTNSDPWGNPFFDRNFWARSMGAPDLRDNLVRWNPLYLDAGTYEVLYYLRPTHPGTYNVIPARIYEQYNPDHMSSHTSGMLFSIEE